MKKLKFVCFIVLLFSTTSLFSQEIVYGIKAGGNFSKWNVEDVHDAKSKFGFIAGFSFDVEFTENLLLKTGLEFNQKGNKYKKNDFKETYNPLYIQLPAHFGYRFNLNPINIVLQGGPYFACGIAGKVKSDDNFNDGNKIFDPDNGIRRIDMGLGAGIGAEYKQYCINMGYDIGLLKLDRDKDQKIYNRNFYITLGYKF